MKVIIMAILLYIPTVFANSVIESLKGAVTTNIRGEKLSFYTVLEDGTSSDWHQIYFQIGDGGLELASSFSILENLSADEETRLFLRAWLTEADNGVNGKNYKGKLAGSEDEVYTILHYVEGFIVKNCQLPESESCLDLMSLKKLCIGIGNEASKQSQMNMYGQGYY